MYKRSLLDFDKSLSTINPQAANMTLIKTVCLIFCSSVLVFTEGIFFPAGGEMRQVTGLLAAVADSFAKSEIHFLLWTRRNPLLFQELFTNNERVLAASNFVRMNPTKIYVHGFTENGQNDLSFRLRERYLKKEDCNFIAVDWALLAMGPDYPKAAANTRPVGLFTGDFVNFLISQGVDLSKLHLIGFSMGAHIVGRAGRIANGVLPRITGLDPAFPHFDFNNPDEVLEKTDARFVDVIHTNAGNLEDGKIGVPLSIGHADFWPNGGSSQPGCEGITSPGGILNIITLFIGGVCSHKRSVEYFIESLNVPFVSTQCNSYNEFRLGSCANNFKTFMGPPVSTSSTGNFFLDTTAVKPFAMERNSF